MQNVKNIIMRAASSVAVVLALGSGAQAQEIPSTEFAGFLEALTAAGSPPKNVYLPGISLATVAPGGTGFASATLMNPRGGTRGLGWDGSTSFGLGFGDAAAGVGVSAQINVTGTQPFGTDGDFSLRFSRQVGLSTYVGLGVNRLGGWGNNARIDPNAELMVTHFTSFGSGAGFTPVMVTLGVSSVGADNQADPGAFGGIGFGLSENVGFGVSVKNGGLNAGFGVTVPSVKGLSLTADVSNINTVSLGSDRIFSFGVHYAFSDLF